MLSSTTETLAGYRVVKHIGLVSGSTVRAKHLGRDIVSSLKNIIGGELHAYTELMTEAREEAFVRMLNQARQLGANAVINVRFATTAISQGASELVAYGTAVWVE